MRASFAGALGRYEEAVEHLEVAIALEPLRPRRGCRPRGRLSGLSDLEESLADESAAYLAFGYPRSEMSELPYTGVGKDAPDLRSIRTAIRAGVLRGTTSGLCPGRVQANVVILPASVAPDFRRFCELNPRACPLLEETVPGEVSPPKCAATADVRTDVPLYRVYRDGWLVDEVEEITALWRADLVTFLLGCSFTFERALAHAGIPLRHREEGKVVPMYRTSVGSAPAGAFSGPLVVSMRPVPESRVRDAFEIAGRYPRAHGAPIRAGEPEALGIVDLSRPDYGDAVTLRGGEVPLFWACGVTSQEAARAARPELLITHSPGRMLIADLGE